MTVVEIPDSEHSGFEHLKSKRYGTGMGTVVGAYVGAASELDEAYEEIRRHREAGAAHRACQVQHREGGGLGERRR